MNKKKSIKVIDRTKPYIGCYLKFSLFNFQFQDYEDTYDHF